MNPFILYKFASRSRPEKFFKAIDNIKSLAKAENYHILATLDSDDLTMNNDTVRQRIIADYSDVVSMSWGTSTNKIHAINRGMDIDLPYTIIVVMSDDMEFIQPGFDLEIINDFNTHFPDYDGVLHYPDGSPNSTTMTMSIMGKAYYDRFGYIYHSTYESVCCDMEAQEVAALLGKIIFIDKKLFVHKHPVWKLAPMDDQYRKTESPQVHNRDRANYDGRKSRSFDIDKLLKKVAAEENDLIITHNAMQQMSVGFESKGVEVGLIDEDVDITISRKRVNEKYEILVSHGVGIANTLLIGLLEEAKLGIMIKSYLNVANEL